MEEKREAGQICNGLMMMWAVMPNYLERGTGEPWGPLEKSSGTGQESAMSCSTRDDDDS